MRTNTAQLSHDGDAVMFPWPIGKAVQGRASTAAMIRLRYGMPWVLAACAAGPHGAGKRELVLKLQHLRVEELLPALREVPEPPRCDSKVDPKSNTITFWATADVLRNLTEQIERLDVPAPRAG